MPTVTEQAKREFVKQWSEKFSSSYNKDQTKEFIETVARPVLGYSKETRWNRIYSSLYLIFKEEFKPVEKIKRVKVYDPSEEKTFKTFPLKLLTAKLDNIKKLCIERKQLTGKTTIQHDWILEAIDEKLEREKA